MAKVRAKEPGYYGKVFRRKGEVFNFPLNDGEKHPKWVEAIGGKVAAAMEPEPEQEAPKAPAKSAGKKEPETEAAKINAATGVTQPDWEPPKAPAAGAEI